MRAFIVSVALAAAGAPAAAGAAVLDGGPEWIKKPDAQDLRAVWPSEALRRGEGGRAIIKCRITTQGLLEACAVDHEEPAGQGFGAAALLLAPSFVLKPAVRDGEPVSTTVRIPINFKNNTGGGRDLGRRQDAAGVRVSMVTEPVWETAPSFAEMAAAWPAKANAPFGHVSMRCGFDEQGRLRNCDVLTETPQGEGFGRAARDAVAPKFRLRVTPETAESIAKAKVNIPVRFTNPASAEPPAIVKPKWITSLDPQKIVDIYPAAAVEAGVKSGRGVADCLVAPDGKLTDCKPAPASPEGLGFSESAVIVASVMRMNPWSDGGGPVDSVRLKLPIRFELAPEEAAELP